MFNKIVCLMIIIGSMSFGKSLVYQAVNVLEKDKIKQIDFLDVNKKIKKSYRVIDYNKKSLPVSGIIMNSKNKKSGLFYTVYNNGEVMLIIEKDFNDSVLSLNYYYEKEGKKYIEKRDGETRLISYMELEKDKYFDVTKEVLDAKNSRENSQFLVKLKSLKHIESILEKDQNIVITETTKNLSIRDAQTNETLLGQIVTDSIKDYSNADIVLINGGIFENGITRGEIKYKDLLNSLKDKNLYYYKIEGSKILELLKRFEKLPNPHRDYLHSAGLTFNNKSKIDDIKVNGVSIDPLKYYSVIVNDHIKNGIGIYYNFKDEKSYKIRYSLPIILANYLYQIPLVDDTYIKEKRQ